MDLREFGEVLRAERERRGLSLREVAEMTKVSRRSLEAIEQANRKDLPHAVYAKGFIRHYSKFLDIDQTLVEETLGLHFSEEEPELQTYSVKTPISMVRSAPQPKRRASLGPLVVIVLLIAAFCGLLGYFYLSATGTQLRAYFYSRIFQKAETPEAPAVEVKAPSVEPEPKPAKEQAKPSGKSGLEIKEIPAAAPHKAPEAKTAEAEAPAPPRREAPAEPEAPAPVPPAPAPAPAPPAVSPLTKVSEEKDFGSSGPQMLEVLANQACWLEATVDQGQTKEYYLTKGQYLTARFKDKINIKLGNAGGVTVRYNGKDVPLTAPKSGVVALQFP